MLRRALILDGLWYTLCPSFDQFVVGRPAPIGRPRKQNSSPRSSQPNCIAVTPSRRCYSSSVSASRNVGSTESDAAGNTSQNGSSSDIEPQATTGQHRRLDDLRRTNGLKHEPEIWAPELKTATIRVYKDLLEKPISYLEGLLQRDKLTTNMYATTQVLRALIRDHHVEPSARHYKALILAHRDSTRGSPHAVRGLLEEMEEDGITADSGTLHAILQVSIIHSSMVFRIPLSDVA